MLESIQNENLEYQKLSQDEMKARGILGRLVGICADFMNPTRNGRLYSEELWERVFNDPIMKERIQNGVCYGELGHPEDREETDMEKIAVCLSSVPKKGKDGKLRAVFDILDTPNGRILKSLCDYGSTLGISSRGSGDLVTGFSGQEEVDPSSYNCEGFDVVLIPAVKEARLQYVTESLDKTRYNKTLRQRLQESLDKATPKDRKIMQEGLNSIGISLKEKAYTKDELMNKFGTDNLDIINAGNEEDVTLKEPKYFKLVSYNPGDAETGIYEDSFDVWNVIEASSEEEAKQILADEIDEVQGYIQPATEEEYKEYIDYTQSDSGIDEQLQKTDDKVRKERIEADIEEYEKDADWADEHNNPGGATQARKKIADLREASSSNIESKEVDNNESELINELQESIKTIKALKNQVVELQEKLSVCYSKEANREDEISSLKEKLSKLSKDSESAETLRKRIKTLSEQLSKERSKSSENDSDNALLKESITKVVDKYNRLVDSYKDLKERKLSLEKSNGVLKEQLQSLKEQLEANKENYSSKLSNANQLVEKYKKASVQAAEKYIDSQAVRIGVTSQEIKNKLPDKYTFNDIDNICESLVDFNLSLSKLPFRTSKPLTENIKMTATPSKEPILPDGSFDDDVDDLLKRLSGMK